ncbi:hypothetical protein Hanom_Chr06g00566941 [Helianthus anomalus]
MSKLLLLINKPSFKITFKNLHNRYEPFHLHKLFAELRFSCPSSLKPCFRFR